MGKVEMMLYFFALCDDCRLEKWEFHQQLFLTNAFAVNQLVI